MLEKLTIRPHPRSRMPGTTARHRWKVPRTLTANVRSQSAVETSHSGWFGPMTPAELTRMSILPNPATAEATASSSATSTTTSAPAARSSVTTSVPSARNRSAVARPRPLIPPVTSARRVMSVLRFAPARERRGPGRSTRAATPGASNAWGGSTSPATLRNARPSRGSCAAPANSLARYPLRSRICDGAPTHDLREGQVAAGGHAPGNVDDPTDLPKEPDRLRSWCAAGGGHATPVPAGPPRSCPDRRSG